MLFSIGVEQPQNKDQAFGLIVPALCFGPYACFSSSDSEIGIHVAAKEAVISIIETLVEAGSNISGLNDKGVGTYREMETYAHCDYWLLVDIDLSDFTGKPKRINISMPDTLIARIDEYVKSSNEYKDRSHFLAMAARHEMR